MEITEVRVRLVNEGREKLRAICSVTFDNEFVIRDVKVIDGSGGAFVAMPSRRLSDRCSKCGGRNHTRARYCNDCGGEIRRSAGFRGRGGREKSHVDIAHPIHSQCREKIQQAVIEAFDLELASAGLGGEEEPSSQKRPEEPREDGSSDGSPPEADEEGDDDFTKGIFH